MPNACADVWRWTWAHPECHRGARVMLPSPVAQRQHHRAQGHRLELGASPAPRGQGGFAESHRAHVECSVRASLESFWNRSQHATKGGQAGCLVWGGPSNPAVFRDLRRSKRGHDFCFAKETDPPALPPIPPEIKLEASLFAASASSSVSPGRASRPSAPHRPRHPEPARSLRRRAATNPRCARLYAARDR